MDFKGKVALVTGAGSGIGLASAKMLAERGARVALVGRTQDELREAQQQIEGAGGEALALVADVSDPQAMQDAYAQVEEKWGRLDIVFANAGINGVWAPLEELTPEDWDQTLSVNLKGTFLTVKYALPLLKKRGGAVIVDSSINGTRVFSNTGASAYSSSKAAQVAFAADEGFTAMFDNGLMNRPAADQDVIVRETQKRNMRLGPFVLLADFATV